MHRRPASPRLSSVWEARTASNGRVYYLNHRTHVTQWELPSPEDDRLGYKPVSSYQLSIALGLFT